MQARTVARPVHIDVAKLVGCTLTDISVRTFRTDFLFSEVLSIIVRINKKFKFALVKDDDLSFDPALMPHDTSIESAKFVFLQGLRCLHAIISSTKFEVAFEGDARLWVEYSDSDFEPLHLIGASGERHEKLDFYHVL